MNLQQFEKLQSKFETLSFEKNFGTINKILFYFSYLGNIFLILFSYFFLKTVTNAIPTLFPGQDIFFSIFIVLFMSGYELFKRFSIEQLFQNWFINKKFTFNFLVGILLCLTLTVGSFYLSVKGSHRLIDNTQALSTSSDSLKNNEISKLEIKYNTDIATIQKQIDNNTTLINKIVDAGSSQSRPLTKAERVNIDNWEKQVLSLKTEKSVLDSTFRADKQKVESGNFTSNVDAVTSEENNLAFLLLTFFLEILIIIGVGFNGYYHVQTYFDMKGLMRTEKYQKLKINLQLLKIYYHNGTKRDGDVCPPTSKFTSLAKTQVPDIRTQDITNFLNLLSELQVTQTKNKKNKTFTVSYDKAMQLIEE